MVDTFEEFSYRSNGKRVYEKFFISDIEEIDEDMYKVTSISKDGSVLTYKFYGCPHILKGQEFSIKFDWKD